MRVIAILIFLIGFSGFAQDRAFGFGENLTYKISYQVQGIYSNIGEISMSTSQINNKGSKYYKFEASANTYTTYDQVFPIRDYFVSFSKLRSLLPILHKRSIKEGVTEKEIKYNFNWNTKKAQFSELKKANKEREGSTDRKKNSTINLPLQGFDILSALYKLRDSSLDQLKVGNRITIPVFFDGKLYSIKLKYQGTKNMNTKIGSKNCYHFSTWISGKDSSISGDLYLTADANKIPVLINANIPVGKGRIELISASGIN